MSKIDWRAFFKPSDLLDPDDAAMANAKLWAFLQCERRAYGNTAEGEYHGEPLSWRTLPKKDDTHIGILISLGSLDTKK